MFRDLQSPLAVMPVLVGPLQVLLALLPAMLLAFGGALLALFKPSGLRKLGRFLWHQKVFSVCLLLMGLAVWQGYPRKIWSGMRNVLGLRAAPVTESASAGEWPTSRGGPHRTGYAGGDEPTSAGNQWAWNDHKTVFSSPTVAGDRVYFTTVTGIGPFTPTGKGAVVCVDAASGRELWRYEGDDGDLRGTFSSPAIGEGRLVVGEGLHQTSDARVTCLDLSGRKMWDFRTSSHVESTPCIHAGRVYVAAAGDGFYCFDLKPDAEGKAQVLWHLTGDRYLDCESSAVSDGETVWFGLGEEGNAIVAVNATDGTERWRVATPYPVFAAPTLVQDESGQGKIYIGMGNGNFVFSADELRAAKVESMRDEGKSAEEIAAVEKKLATAGAVWSIDSDSGEVEWKHALPDMVLDSIAYQPSAKAGDPGWLYFGSRDGHAYALSADGKPLGKWNAGSPILASPALARQHVYFATKSGRLFALKSDTLQPVWDMTVQQSGTLTSSPAVAEGRVFIGTEDQGLRCVGTSEPPLPPMSNPPYVGGSTEDVSIPDQMEVAWTFLPEPVEKPRLSLKNYRVWGMVGLDGALYVNTSELYGQTIPTLTRLENDAGDDARPKVVWQRRMPSGSFQGVGGLLFFDSLDGGRRILEAFDVRDGTSVWKHEWPNETSSSYSGHEDQPYDSNPGVGADRDRLYFWTHKGRITCVNQADGETVWTTETALEHLARFGGPHGVGRPIPIGDLILCSAGMSLVALDKPTGRILWVEQLDARLRQSPVVAGRTIALSTDLGLCGFDLLTGKRRWMRKKDERHFLMESALQPWDSDSNSLITFGTDGVALVDVRDGSLMSKPQRENPTLVRSQWSFGGVQRGDEVLVSHLDRREADANNFSLQWWHPKEGMLRSACDLKDMGVDISQAIILRGRLYLRSNSKGVVCLRGVRP